LAGVYFEVNVAFKFHRLKFPLDKAMFTAWRHPIAFQSQKKSKAPGCNPRRSLSEKLGIRAGLAGCEENIKKENEENKAPAAFKGS
jgi:hypothetical protein